MEQNARIFIAGHRGLVGSAVVRNLTAHGYTNLVLRTRAELNLLNQPAVHQFFQQQHIDYVIVAAAKVGGILFNNTHQADFLYENVTIASNIIHAAAQSEVKKLLYLGSSCIYPREAPQPIKEEFLLTGPLEPTNEGYALAKIVGLKLCEKYQKQYGKNFVSVMPTNLYGENDNYHPDRSHVIPGMMRRFHEAKVLNLPEVVIWGSGRPMREFLYIDDLAEALRIVMLRYSEPSTINVGTGQDCSIADLAHLMKEVVQYPGKLSFDISKPDGMMRKVLDVTRMKALGWSPSVTLPEGLRRAYAWACANEVFK